MGRPTVIICGRRNCTHCGRWRPITDFTCLRRDANGEAIWLNSWCRPCDNERRRVRDPQARLRKAENARIWRRLRAEQEGRQVTSYKVLNPWTGNRITVAALDAYLSRKEAMSR